MSAPTAAQPKRTRRATPAAKQAKENKDNRGRGSRYSDANLSIMLDLADEHLPAGGDEWNNVALLYNQHFGNGEDRKNWGGLGQQISKTSQYFQANRL